MTDPSTPATTPLHALHVELGARLVPFAGYAMPVQYGEGILAEHRWCREAAALFDVSHMGQIRLLGIEADIALEALMPIDVVGLRSGRQRYGFLTTAAGGILDDVMISRRRVSDTASGSDLLLVVNAANKLADLAHLNTQFGQRAQVQALHDQALLALQGPKAAAVLARLDAGVADLAFMSGGFFTLGGAACFVTRSGYSGEDGFEISVPAAQAEALARELLAQPEVHPAGLGARDTLRLETGLCLHGQDITATTTPVEAGLAWAIGKARRPGGERAGGYPGSAVIERQLGAGVSNRRVGLIGLERVPVRAGTALVDAHGHKLGHVTSGTLAPTLGAPIAMAYLPANHAISGHEVFAEVRGRRLPMKVTSLPFVSPRYHRA